MRFSTLQQYRNDEPLMERVSAALGIVAVVMLGITLLRMSGGYVFAAPQVSSSPYPPVPSSAGVPAEAATITVAELEVFLAGCMRRSARLDWTEPHTGRKMALFCENVYFPLAK